MSGGEIEIILEEIRSLKNDIKEDLGKVFKKIENQNDRIISAEKDIEYLKIDLDNKVYGIEKDLNDFFKLFRDFKSKDLSNIIDNNIEKRINKVLVVTGVNLFGLMGTAIGFFIYEFVLKGVDK